MDYHHPAAFCPVHGIFPATGFGFSGSGSYIGCFTNCPKCDRSSEVIPGTYEVLPDGLNILVDPSISDEALAAIQRLVVRLQRSEITLEEAKAEAEKISPAAGKLFDIANWSDQAKATFYGAIICAVAAVASAGISRGGGTNVTVQPVIERVIERGISDFSTSMILSNVPIPKPRPK